MEELFEEDPFLCPECAKVGYCIEARKKRSEVTEEANTSEEEDASFPEELIESESEIREEELVEQE
jgi:hypothetical protein